MSNLFGAFHISFCFGHFYSGKRGSRRNFERDLTGQINYRRFVPRRFSSLENCIYNKNADSLFHESRFAIFVSDLVTTIVSENVARHFWNCKEKLLESIEKDTSA